MVLGPAGVSCKLAFGSNKHEPCSVWPCAPRRIHKGLGEEVGIGFMNGSGSVGFMRRYYFNSCSRTYYLGYSLIYL